MRNRLLGKQKGMILPVVLIFFSVLMLLGVTIVSVGGNQVSGSMNQVNRSQAYYLAKSGAESFAEHLVESSKSLQYGDMNQLLDIVKGVGKTSVEGGEISLNIIEDIDDSGKPVIRIISTANYNRAEAEATVVLALNKTTSGIGNGPIINNAALLLVSDNNSITPMKVKGGAKIIGDVYVNFTKDDSIRLEGGDKSITGGNFYIPIGTSIEELTNVGYGTYKTFITSQIKTHNETFSITVPNIPTVPILPSKPDIIVSGKKDLTISESGTYNNILIESNNTLIVDLKNTEVEIRVKNLSLSGKIQIINAGASGKLKVYVEDTLDTNYGSMNMNTNSGLLSIYYMSAKKLNIASDITINGSIFIKQADLTISGGAKVKGTIVSLGKNITLSGGSFVLDSVIYAPNAIVISSGSGSVNGSILAKSLEASGGSIFTYKETSYDFPEGVFDDGEDKIELNFGDNPWN